MLTLSKYGIQAEREYCFDVWQSRYDVLTSVLKCETSLSLKESSVISYIFMEPIPGKSQP